MKYRILSNQYLPDGLGKPAKTYWYIQRSSDKKTEVYCHNGTWKVKPPMDIQKYAFFNEDKPTDLVRQWFENEA